MNRTFKAVAFSVAIILASGAALGASSPRGITDPNSATAMIPSDKRPIITPSSVTFGAYDPHGDFSADPNSKIEHLFLPWEDVDLSTLTIVDEYAAARHRSLLITVEPWSWDRDWRMSGSELYAAIVNGRYDVNIATICSAISQLKSSATVRFAQEMDETNNQFTWAHWTGPDYIRVYRRFVKVCRQHLTKAKFMWSPKGNPNLREYYPGDDVVDVIGLSVFGYQPYDRHTIGHDGTFVELLTPGYNLVKGYGKPIVVAELGYEGDQAYDRDWAEEAAKRHPQFPKLTAVVYFDDREVYPWPDGYGRPDWRVVQETTN